MNDTPEPHTPDESANARTARMPAIRRPDFADDVRPAPAPGQAPRVASTPWLVVVGVLALLLVAGGVYVLVSDRSPGAGAGSSTSAPPTNAGTTGGGTGEGGSTGEFGDDAPTSADESIELPTKPDKKKPGKGSCKAATTPKKAGGSLVQDVVISCSEPTSLTIETAGKAVITLDGEKHTGTVQTCAAEVDFTVTGGAYKWSADGPCEP